MSALSEKKVAFAEEMRCVRLIKDDLRITLAANGKAEATR
jgi:hypothetical protein